MVLITVSALVLDLVAGDPPNRCHPTAWIGRLIARITVYFKSDDPRTERMGGVAIVVIPVALVMAILVIIYSSLDLLEPGLLYSIIYVLLGVVLLKITIAIHGMEQYARSVAQAVSCGDIASARSHLAAIVKRDTSSLDESHIISGAVESVSENTVDGITGPLFYFGILGIPGAFVHRVVNTADSMVGYRTGMFSNLGRFAAGCDTVLNYVPARITALITILASALLGMDWKGSYHVMLRDGKRTDSHNAGYPMAAAAGALGARLEKKGHYALGNGHDALSVHHIYRAIRLMKITSFVFCCTVTIPMAVSLLYVGWWIGA